ASLRSVAALWILSPYCSKVRAASGRAVAIFSGLTGYPFRTGSSRPSTPNPFNFSASSSMLHRQGFVKIVTGLCVIFEPPSSVHEIHLSVLIENLRDILCKPFLRVVLGRVADHLAGVGDAPKGAGVV